MSESTSERWLPVVGWAFYDISSHGRVRSLPRPAGTTGPKTVRILKPQKQSSGHLFVHLSNEGCGKQRRIHQLVLEAFVGPCPPGMEGRHLDDDPSNNHVSNLVWGTRSDNQQDAVRNGRNARRSRTHCPQEHPYDEANTVWYDGARHCKTCLTEQGAKYRAKDPEKVRRASREAMRRHRARKRAEAANTRQPGSAGSPLAG